MIPPNCTNFEMVSTSLVTRGDQRAAALGVLGQRGQVVDAPEGPQPQRRQPVLGGGEQPHVDQVGAQGGGRTTRGEEDEAG